MPGDPLRRARIAFYSAAVRHGETTPTPEPGTWVLMGTGLVGLLGYGWRRKKRQAV